jgi:hypothetical protein
MPRRLLFSLVCLVAVGVVSPAASAAPASCGALITESMTLTTSLTGCASGLVVGADSITIDLNGRSIQGSGEAGSVGIDLAGRRGVTIRNGSIRGFATGVRLSDTSGSRITGLTLRDVGTGILLANGNASAESNEVAGNTIMGALNGVVMFQSFDRVSGNAIVNASGNGILCRDGGGGVISGNVASRNQVGINLFFCTADLVGNLTLGNSADGIARVRAAGRVERNISNQNGGNGINSDDSHANFIRNMTIGNGGSGLVITDSIADHGPFYTVTGHISLGNSQYGIFTNLAGIVDGGGNFARGNGGAAQCFGFVCN